MSNAREYTRLNCPLLSEVADGVFDQIAHLSIPAAVKFLAKEIGYPVEITEVTGETLDEMEKFLESK